MSTTNGNDYAIKVAEFLETLMRDYNMTHTEAAKWFSIHEFKLPEMLS